MSTIALIHEEEELVTLEELLQLPPFRKIHPDTFGRMRRKGLFPYLRIGHKSYLYRPSDVLAALRQLERPVRS
jgi:hypothetical protein